ILKPVAQIQTVKLTVNASPAVEAVFITGNIPAHEKKVIVDGEQTIIVSGEGIVPQAKARGVVEFRNLTKQLISIPVGTVVNAGAVRFVTTEDGVVAAGTGKKISLPIEAIDGGSAGNVEAQTINAIEGQLALSLSVINLEPASGGRERASVQANDGDR